MTAQTRLEPKFSISEGFLTKIVPNYYVAAWCQISRLALGWSVQFLGPAYHLLSFWKRTLLLSRVYQTISGMIFLHASEWLSFSSVLPTKGHEFICMAEGDCASDSFFYHISFPSHGNLDYNPMHMVHSSLNNSICRDLLQNLSYSTFEIWIPFYAYHSYSRMDFIQSHFRSQHQVNTRFGLVPKFRTEKLNALVILLPTIPHGPLLDILQD